MGDREAERREAEAAAARRWEDVPADLKQSLIDRLMRQHPGGRSEKWYTRQALKQFIESEVAARNGFHY